MMQGLKHAYKQAPWRNQLRGIAWILLVMVVFILVAITNLNVSARTYEAGIEIQRMNSQKNDLNQEIADMKNQLGMVTSYQSMAEKANERGYQKLTEPEQTVYIVIPGYQPPAVSIEVPTLSEENRPSVIKPVYTLSLWDLFMDGALKLSKKSKGAY